MNDADPAVAPAVLRLCANREHLPDPLPDLDGGNIYRTEAIRLCARKWTNGSTLGYCFLERDLWQWDNPQRASVRAAFQTWQDLGIGLSFREEPNEAKAAILIGHMMNDDSFSFVGTDVLRHRDRERTMNFAVDLTTSWGHATALHEIGHTLGLEHEHQNPWSGIQWNEPVALAKYRHSTQWDDDKIRRNIFEKMPANQAQGSNWDPHSIMHYPVEPGAMQLPHPYDATGVGENITLSPQDMAWVRYWYPANLALTPADPGSCNILSAKSGDQAAFSLTPAQSGFYTMAIKGTADAVMVLFEERDDVLHQLEAKNDAGTDANARITTALRKGARYQIQIRTVYADKDTPPQFVIE